jgi:hypothetical protein
MRAIDCPCGHRLEGDYDEPVRLARVDSHHPDMERSGDELRQLVAAGAHDA